LPNIGYYLDQRIKASHSLPSDTQHDLKKGFLDTLEYWHGADKYCEDDNAGDASKWLHKRYMTYTGQPWHPNHIIESKLFEKRGVTKKMQINYIDVPMLHADSPSGIAFIKALSELSTVSEEVSFSVYDKRSV